MARIHQLKTSAAARGLLPKLAAVAAIALLVFIANYPSSSSSAWMPQSNVFYSAVNSVSEAAYSAANSVSQLTTLSTDNDDYDESQNDDALYVIPEGGSSSSSSKQPKKLDILTSPPVYLEGNVEECQLIRGDWCKKFHKQQLAVWRPPPQGKVDCLWGCNRVGVCDGLAGWCMCPAGWQGDACDVPMPRTCTQNFRQFGFDLKDDPVNYDQEGSMVRCAGECDKTIALCFCASNTTYGRVPADTWDPPGTPPKKFGRPMNYVCQPNRGPDGRHSYMGQKTPEELHDWCNNPQPSTWCPCAHDNLGGQFCDKPKQAYCVNQCNGHGDCQMGFCKCHEGWFGQDCAYRNRDVVWAPGIERERPYIQNFVHTPASWDTPPNREKPVRKRPLIYIYEVPPKFTNQALQFRLDLHQCTPYQIWEGNQTMSTQYTYQFEIGFHEYLSQSEHRTLDPEEADFFYIPVYASCWMSTVYHNADFPWWHGGAFANRAQSATNMFIEAYSWVRSHHPYWNRHNGKDHIIVATHDEMSCYVPAILRNATIISHWGQTLLNNLSYTNYGPDEFSWDVRDPHPHYSNEGYYMPRLGLFPCFDEKKDLVVPSMWSPEKYEQSPMLGAPTRERVILGLHKGRLLQEFPKFSRGIRQKLANLTRDHQWWEKHKIYIGESNPPGIEGGYTDILASSVFCFVLQGDGWTSRFEDAVTHGCIPVILMDEVYVPFETALKVEEFSIRWPIKDLEKLPEKLKAVPQATIEKLQNNLPKVWRRYMYSGYRMHNATAHVKLANRREQYKDGYPTAVSQPEPINEYDPFEMDAFQTILQWLYGRLEKRKF